MEYLNNTIAKLDSVKTSALNTYRTHILQKHTGITLKKLNICKAKKARPDKFERLKSYKIYSLMTMKLHEKSRISTNQKIPICVEIQNKTTF